MGLLKVITPGDGSPLGTKVIDVETGEEVKGVRRVDIKIAVDDAIRMTVELCANAVEAQGVAEYQVADPKTGKLRKVKRIEFADGETIDF